MNKREFLETLKEALSEEMPASLVRENVQYYSQYIEGEGLYRKRSCGKAWSSEIDCKNAFRGV